MGWTSGFLEMTETLLAKHLIQGIIFSDLGHILCTFCSIAM